LNKKTSDTLKAPEGRGEHGDGVMSAIDFDMAIERVANPTGDRVKITMSGKFLPYKYYGASGNVSEYGFKEG
jgi:cyanate lyase